MTDVRNGDYVKVTIEGKVTHAEDGDDWIIVNGMEVLTTASGIKIEKTTPKFKSGDTLRFKYNGAILTLGEDGFLDHTDGQFHEYGKNGYLTLNGFGENWLNYDRVELTW